MNDFYTNISEWLYVMFIHFTVPELKRNKISPIASDQFKNMYKNERTKKSP